MHAYALREQKCRLVVVKRELLVTVKKKIKTFQAR